MPRTFFDLNLLANNIVAKLGNIVGEHVKFDIFASNVGQFGHTLRSRYQSDVVKYALEFKRFKREGRGHSKHPKCAATLYTVRLTMEPSLYSH